MGGNLFKLGRISKERYLQIHRKIKPYLDSKFGKHYAIPRYYANKADFGDMDIILSSEIVQGNWPSIKQDLITDLGLVTTKSSGNIFSTVYENFQVDFFIRDKPYFESSYNFLSFNDIGNLIGKICRRFNLKYGEQGLAYVYRRADGHYNKDLQVSLDFKQIYEFLGLDFEKWQEGFQSREEMFEWVIDSPYFSVTPYQKLSTSLEKRKRERTTIKRFLAYLEEKKITKTYAYFEDRDAYLAKIDKAFPSAKLLQEIAREKKLETYQKVIKDKFNGKIIMSLKPELSGKELGAFIIKFKAQFENPEAWLYTASKEKIQERIINLD